MDGAVITGIIDYSWYQESSHQSWYRDGSVDVQRMYGMMSHKKVGLS